MSTISETAVEIRERIRGEALEEALRILREWHASPVSDQESCDYESPREYLMREFRR